MTQAKLKEVFSYDEYTGKFTRLKNGKLSDSALGKTGYVTIQIDYKNYRSHRMAWVYMYGEEANHIDHINHNRSDNRIQNLRSVTQAENNRNMSILNGRTLPMGVTWDRFNSKYKAQINVDGKTKNLGRYATIEEALAVRKNAEKQYDYHMNIFLCKRCSLRTSVPMSSF